MRFLATLALTLASVAVGAALESRQEDPDPMSCACKDASKTVGCCIFIDAPLDESV